MDLREQTYKQEHLSAQDRLWGFATAVYAKPEVAPACIAAQEEHAVDVNLMLYVSWCAHESFALKAEHIPLAEDRCRRWREQVIVPLREQRMVWRTQESFAVEYAAIKELELQAERTQLDFLATLFDQTIASRASARRTPETEALLRRKHLDLLAVHYRLEGEVFGRFHDALAGA